MLFYFYGDKTTVTVTAYIYIYIGDHGEGVVQGDGMRVRFSPRK